MILTNEQTITEFIQYTCTLNPSNNDTVSSATWSITPLGPTISVPANTSTASTIVLSNLSAPTVYILNCHFVGGSGQQYDGYLQITAVTRHN